MSTSQFTYQPLSRALDSIRLLTVHHDTNGTITGHLSHVTFASKPAYEAISCASIEHNGTTRQITVDGSTLEIPEELFHLLTSVCPPGKPRTIWVAGVCMNEGDVDEKNYQRGIMYMIYSRATRVIVWLGVPQHPVQDGEGFGLYGENHSAGEEIAASPYWNDAWAIQDIGLAKDLHFYYGAYCFTWQTFQAQVMDSYDETKKRMELVLGRKLEDYERESMPEPDFEEEIQKPLEVLLEEYKDTQCRETRDKIFAFLGLSSDWSDDIIRVDYRMSFYELYARAIEFQQIRPPLYVPFFEGITTESLDRPARLVAFSRLVQSLLGGEVEEEARNPNVQKEHREKHYHARGALRSEIRFLGPTYLQCISSSRANVQWKRDLEAHFRTTPEDLRKARQSNEKYSRIIQAWSDEYPAKIRALNSQRSYGYQERADTSVHREEQQSVGDTESSKGPRRFLGTNGIIGFVPPEAQIGDNIYAFWECDIGVVLRESGPDRWTLIGRADVAPIERAENMLWCDALMLDVDEQDREYTVTDGDTVLHMMNLHLDLDTLQKLTV